jgi:adenosylcobinamide kinase/adenosylcobinamide-phosphate guanylyltransferase
MRVTLLGTGSADGWPNPFCACDSCDGERLAGRQRQPSAALVDDLVLIDCGPTAPHAVSALGSSLRDVEHVLITHGHPDHLDPAFLLAREWVGVGHALHVWAPPHALDLCRPWIGPSSPVVLHEVRPGDAINLPTVRGPYQAVALPAAHSSGNGDELADEAVLYLLTSPDGGRLLYATDTAELPPATVQRMAGAVDLVVVDETFGDTIDHGTGHLDLVSLPRLLDGLRRHGAITDRTVVIATHLSHHNPATPVLTQRLAGIGVGVVDDLTTIDTAVPPPPPPHRTSSRHLVLGGARSGKSRLAEELTVGTAAVTYVATGGTRPDDAEWRARVDSHQARRPRSWTTIETIEVDRVLASADVGTVVLVDCIALWLTGHLDAIDAWARLDAGGRAAVVEDISRRCTYLVDSLIATRADVILVSNEVGMGVVPSTASGRLFQDLLGTVNAQLAAACDRVTLVVAGLPVALKQPLDPPNEGA